MGEFQKPVGETLFQNITVQASAEMLVRHDIRNIKVSPTQTIAVDLEDIKRAIERSFFKPEFFNEW